MKKEIINPEIKNKFLLILIPLFFIIPLWYQNNLFFFGIRLRYILFAISSLSFVLYLYKNKLISIAFNYNTISRSTFEILLFIYYVSLIISTLINKISFSSSTFLFLLCPIFVYMVINSTKATEDFNYLLLVISIISLLFLFVNTINVILTGGMSWQGTRNISEYGSINHTVVFTLWGFYGSIVFLKRKKPVLFFLYFMNFFISYILPNRITSLLFLIFVIASLLMEKQIKKHIKFFISAFICFIVLFEINTFLPGTSNIFSEISTVLGKGNNMSDRFILWNNALQVIRENLIWGKGLLNPIFENKTFLTGSSAHNYVFDIMLRGGIISLIPALSINLFPLFIIFRNPTLLNIKNNYYVFIFSTGIVLMSLAEAWLFWQFISFPFFCHIISERNTNENTN